jgi:hexosaminidase
MCPQQSLYLNFYQNGPEQEPLAIGKRIIPIDKVYAYEPIPEELSTEEAKHILGAQACVWTEYISTFPHVQYMALPRAAALAEITWSPKESRDFVSFKTRVQELCQHYKAAGWVYRPLTAPTNVQVF